MAAPPDPRPYLSVLSWPAEHGRELVAQLLADAMGGDYDSIRLRLGAAPPSIVGQFDAAAAHRGLAALRESGGDGFLVTLGALEAMGASLKIRDLQIVDGGLDVEIWRGPTTTIRREDVQLLIRAQLAERTVDRLQREHDIARETRAQAGMHMMAFGGGMGLAMAVGAAYAQSAGQTPPHLLKTSDKLDIHTANGTIFQIDGDKFAYRVLGDMRGYGDKANMDRMCELLAHVSPNEIVDPYFELWNPPVGVERLRLPGLPSTRSEKAFAFYSRWAARMYRHLLGQV